MVILTIPHLDLKRVSVLALQSNPIPSQPISLARRAASCIQQLIIEYCEKIPFWLRYHLHNIPPDHAQKKETGRHVEHGNVLFEPSL